MESELQDESPNLPSAGSRRTSRRGKAMLIVGMAAVGAGIGGAGIANAATNGSSATTAATSASSSAASSTAKPADPATVAHGPNETLLTGTTADKVKAAALAANPGATIIRVETDSAGSPYEAHIKKADGTEATVKVDANFKVTSTESGFGGGPAGQGPRGGGPSAGASGTGTPSA